MEEKKSFDFKSFLGFILIGAVVLFWLQTKKEEEAKKKAEDKAKTEQTVKAADSSQEKHTTHFNNELAKTDSSAKGTSNFFAQNTASDQVSVLENDVLRVKVSNKGGQIVEVRLKGMTNYDSVPIYLIKNHNASFGLTFSTADHKTLNTQDIYFEPTLSENSGNSILTMRANVGNGKYLEYVYTMKPDEYMMDFVVRSHGLKNIISQAEPVKLHWKLKSYHYDKSFFFEKRFSEAVWQYEGNKISDDRSGESTAKDISWLAYRQHFFSSILLNDNPFQKGKIKIEEFDEEKTAEFTKAYSATFPLQLKGGELNENMNLYFGPTKYHTLLSYERNLDEIMPLGWGIFGWLNKYIFIPVFSFLNGFLPAGIAIILLTVIVKIACSPVQYKQFMSQAKRKVLKPEIDAINEKFKGNKMKIQKETMNLNREAGINQTSGCIMGLIQLPIFYAMYRLFPSAFQLRHQSFLWVDDLSSYDSILNLSFRIPLYGSHVSLMALLAAVAILIYMMFTTGQTMQNMPKQPGMPNMKFIMYLSPIAMLLFFNRYPSGMSLYYLTSNLIAIGIYLFIQYVIIDEEKVHAKVEAHKKKPKKQNRFQRKMQEMMEEAEKQQKLKNK